ncbi:uncharacterized hit-like protein rv1262c [Phtheirospermum japonicum]|uniref:Uncharacterized hit-like protein rv1262c n=1 Tax=Phtheirospermum japonicum TaxID=374723 RepID=A0A830CLF5_9LAMI|nr:uncharacterized hit-like protein rv1262c [Phtheirospermum japonicum]
MEYLARRRIDVLSSHVNPPADTTTPPTCLLASACASDPNGEKEMEKGHSDCVFCKIIRGQAPALKLYEDDECLCILDSYPLCHGHSLIIPKCHFPSLDATPPPIIGAMCSKVPLISNAVMEATGCAFQFKKIFMSCKILSLKENIDIVNIVDICLYIFSNSRCLLVDIDDDLYGTSNEVKFPHYYSPFDLRSTLEDYEYSFNLLVNNGAAAGQVIYHIAHYIIKDYKNTVVFPSSIGPAPTILTHLLQTSSRPDHHLQTCLKIAHQAPDPLKKPSPRLNLCPPREAITAPLDFRRHRRRVAGAAASRVESPEQTQRLHALNRLSKPSAFTR